MTIKKETQGWDLRQNLLAAITEAKKKRPDQVGLRPVPAWKKTQKPATPDGCRRGDARP